MNLPTYIYTRELSHHGIKGMKWGIRRYQNKNGTLTPAGRKRYSEDVQNAKTRMDNAKKNRDSANKEFSKVYNKYSMLPTDKNYKLMIEARKKLTASTDEYKKARLGYKVAKTEANGGFDSTGTKSKHRTMLEEKYQKQGYTAKEAAVLAADRIRTEKVVASAAALTITAATAYAINRRIQDRTDQILKSGTLLQRIEMQDTGGKLHDSFYVSTGKHDNKRYEGALGLTRKMDNGEAYIMKLQANRDIKVASNDKAAKVFGDLYKNDPDFRDSVKDSVSKHFLGKNRVSNIDNMNDKNIRKMYDNFNSGLPLIRESGSGADKKFYNKLKSAGYDAIQDINDKKYSGYRAKNPLIIFNNAKDNVTVKSVKELTDKGDLMKKGMVEIGKGSVEGMGQLLASPYAAAATTGTAAAMYISDHKKTDKGR